MGDVSIVYLHGILTVMADHIDHITNTSWVQGVSSNVTGALSPYCCVFAAVVCQNTPPSIDSLIFKQLHSVRISQSGPIASI